MQTYTQKQSKAILTSVGLLCIVASILLGIVDKKPQIISHPVVLPKKINQLDPKDLVSNNKLAELEEQEKKELTKKIDNLNKLQEQEYTVKKGDTLSDIFKKNKIPYSEIVKIMQQSKKHEKNLANLIPGQTIKISKNHENQLKNLTLELSSTKSIKIDKDHKIDNYNVKLHEKTTNKKVSFNGNIIKNSLYQSAAEVGLNQKLISKMTDLFVWDIDFALDLRIGDNFRLLYEEEYVENKKIDSGDILVAEFVNRGKKHQAIKYTNANGKTSYYSPLGKSLQKAFLRAPLKFSRISSHFDLNRKHPILHIIRAHKGVDYAAAKGTPVKASGDGKVSFIGVKSGYGNVIILQHASKYTTLYGHLSKFAKNLRKGAKVSQGDVIGYVGSTGLATAPHLHYEFRINGIHHDPVTVSLPQSLSIASSEKDKFLQHVEKLLKTLDDHENNKNRT